MKMHIARATAIGAMMIAASVASGQTAMMTGTVTDRISRQPVEGVTVVIEGTMVGATTKANGTYTLLGVPAGVHTVVVKRIGYDMMRVPGIAVSANGRNVYDFQIEATGTMPTPATRPPRVEAGSVGAPPSVRTPPPLVERGVVGVPASVAPRPPEPMSLPPIEQWLFPPELVMQHQRALDLSAEQRRVITEAVKSLQNQTVDLQWNLQAEQQALIVLLEKRPINEQAAVTQMAKLVDLEDAVKRTHLATLIKIKNSLTEKQVDVLNSLRFQRQDDVPPPERREWETALHNWDSSLHEWSLSHDWAFDHRWTDLHEWAFPVTPEHRRQ